jgi:hypothetical protein
MILSMIWTKSEIRLSKHVLANEHRYIFGIATVDIDGDGDLDLTHPTSNPQEDRESPICSGWTGGMTRTELRNLIRYPSELRGAKHEQVQTD